MRRLTLVLITLILFSEGVFSQHTITLIDRSYSPEGILNWRGKVTIVPESQSIRVDWVSYGTKYFNFEVVKDVVDKDGNIIWSQKDFEAKLLKKECEKNSNISAIILPLKDDIYGLREMVESIYDTLCFDVSNHVDVLEFIEEKNIDIDRINEFHLNQIIEKFNIDIIVHGYTYRVEVPYKFSATSVDPTSALKYGDYGEYSNVVNGLLSFVYSQSETKSRNNAILSSGSYINMTLYSFSKKTKRKNFLYLNQPMIKVG